MSQEIERIQTLVKDVEGYFGDNEGAFLYTAAKKCTGQGAIVEIGSWKGRSTIWLAKASLAGPGTKVHAVDPHTGSPEHQKQFGKVDTFADFQKNIADAGVEEMVVPVRKTSEDAALEWDGSPIEFLWIDGAHEYDMVQKDYELWSPYLVEGGIVAFHDTGLRRGTQGPKEFVEKYIFPSREYKGVTFFETITIARKVKQNTLFDRMKNRYMLLLKRTYQWLRYAQFPKPRFARRLCSRFVQRNHI